MGIPTPQSGLKAGGGPEGRGGVHRGFFPAVLELPLVAENGDEVSPVGDGLRGLFF